MNYLTFSRLALSLLLGVASCTADGSEEIAEKAAALRVGQDYAWLRVPRGEEDELRVDVVPTPEGTLELSFRGNVGSFLRSSFGGEESDGLAPGLKRAEIVGFCAEAAGDESGLSELYTTFVVRIAYDVTEARERFAASLMPDPESESAPADTSLSSLKQHLDAGSPYVYALLRTKDITVGGGLKGQIQALDSPSLQQPSNPSRIARWLPSPDPNASSPRTRTLAVNVSQTESIKAWFGEPLHAWDPRKGGSGAADLSQETLCGHYRSLERARRGEAGSASSMDSASALPGEERVWAYVGEADTPSSQTFCDRLWTETGAEAHLYFPPAGLKALYEEHPYSRSCRDEKGSGLRAKVWNEKGQFAAIVLNPQNTSKDDWAGVLVCAEGVEASPPRSTLSLSGKTTVYVISQAPKNANTPWRFDIYDADFALTRPELFFLHSTILLKSYAPGEGAFRAQLPCRVDITP